MIKVFLSSPYRADTHNGVAENIAQARTAATKLWSLGYGVFCPVLNSAWMSGVCDEEQFLKFYLEMIPLFPVLVCNHGWENSEGCWKEQQKAHAKGLLIYFIDAVPPAERIPECLRPSIFS